MIDQQKRVVDYLRVSVTDRCNLRCVYCMPEQGVASLPHSGILTYDEILRICRVMAADGLRRVKVTGGEPLVRRNVASLIAGLKAIPGVDSVTLTTNGVLLPQLAAQLVSAGIDSVTVSLDTLDRARYAALTRRDELPAVLDGLACLEAYPQVQRKINCVPLGSEADIVAIAGLAQKQPLHVRFIEVMPIGYARGLPFRSEAEIRRLLEAAYGPLTPYQGRLGNGPAHYAALPGFCGKIGFISAISHRFCARCNRVRLTAEGILKGCLQFEGGADLRQALRAGCGDEALARIIRAVVAAKPEGHHFGGEADGMDDARAMSQIGG